MVDDERRPQSMRDVANWMAGWADRLQSFQATMSRFKLPAEQRAQMQDAMRRLVFPREQLQAMKDLLESWAPPGALLERIRVELADQRASVEAVGEQLDRLEKLLNRYAEAAEDVAALNAPFRKLLAAMSGD